MKKEFQMKRVALKKEIVAYGDDVRHVLEYVTEGLSSPQPPAPGDISIDFSKLRKLKISIKQQSGQIYLKCKVKYVGGDEDVTPPPDEIHTDRDIPDFKTLKKRMDKSFKSIGERLENGGLPSHIETELFCSNAERMTTFPGHGDSMYPEFLQVIREFQEAFHQADIETCLSLYARIAAMKKNCHHNE